MVAVWGGISNETEISITVASQRHTLKGILDRGAFVVSMADVENEAACDYLGITESHMYKLTSGGKIPHYKPTGKLIYFSRSELDDWLLHNRVFNEIDQDNEQNRHIDQESE